MSDKNTAKKVSWVSRVQDQMKSEANKPKVPFLRHVLDSLFTGFVILASYMLVLFTAIVSVPSIMDFVGVNTPGGIKNADVYTALTTWLVPSLVLIGFLFALDIVLIRFMWRARTRFIILGRIRYGVYTKDTLSYKLRGVVSVEDANKYMVELESNSKK